MVVGAVTEGEVVQGGESNGKVDKVSSRKHRCVCREEEGLAKDTEREDQGAGRAQLGETTGGEPFSREVIASHPKHHRDVKR